MDLDKLIQDIISQVENTVNTKNIGRQSGVLENSFSNTIPVASGAKNLYIFCGPALRKEDVAEVVEKSLLSDPFPKYVAVTTSFINQYGTSFFNRPDIVLLNDESYYRVDEILASTNKIYIPILSLNTASKVGKLISDNLVTNLILMGILREKPIEASLKYLLPQNVLRKSFLEEELQRMIARLQALGITFVYNFYKTASITASSTNSAISTVSSGCSQQNGGGCLSCGLCIEKREEDIRKLIADGVVRVSSTTPVKNIPRDLARYIDHTLLKPEATEEQIIKLCEEAKQYGFASVCVNPGYVPLASKMLKGTPVKVCTVIGFPLGATTTETKAFETEDAIKKGAQEVDMVINIGWLKSKNYGACEEDIRAVVRAAACYNVLVKVIIETALLTDEEKVMACSLAKSAGAHYVKTSTGFSKGGATAEDIALMRKVVGENMGVKASGGVRDTETALKMIESGATRIGASASLAIIGAKGGGKSDY